MERVEPFRCTLQQNIEPKGLPKLRKGLVVSIKLASSCLTNGKRFGIAHQLPCFLGPSV